MYQKSQTQLPADEFLLMNVEALATPEDVGKFFNCIGSGDVLCEEIGVRVAYVHEGYSLRK